MNKIKLGKIYKRKALGYSLDSSLIGLYPEYVALTSIHDYMRERKRYKFLDVITGEQSIAVIPEIVVEEYYELVDIEDMSDAADTADTSVW